MKTISLEVEEHAYKDVINFLRLLPKENFRVMEEDSDKLSLEEQAVVQALQARLQAGDESEFEDWETVKLAQAGNGMLLAMNNKQLKVQLAGLESKMAGCLKEFARTGSQAPAWEPGWRSSSFARQEARASSTEFPSWSLGTSAMIIFLMTAGSRGGVYK